MADPVLVDTPIDVWTLIAENVLQGLVDRRTVESAAYYFTTRPTGSAIPPITDIGDSDFKGEPKFLEGRSIAISAPQPIDVYVLCTVNPGRVMVTL